jgi:hypothetical protein
MYRSITLLKTIPTRSSTTQPHTSRHRRCEGYIRQPRPHFHLMVMPSAAPHTVRSGTARNRNPLQHPAFRPDCRTTVSHGCLAVVPGLLSGLSGLGRDRSHFPAARRGWRRSNGSPITVPSQTHAARARGLAPSTVGPHQANIGGLPHASGCSCSDRVRRGNHTPSPPHLAHVRLPHSGR